MTPEEKDRDSQQPCHLCGRIDRPLHGRSHVIPSWLYRQIGSDDGAGVVAITPDEFRRSIEEGQDYNPPEIHPDLESPYDRDWYCVDCERLFGKHDDFSAKFLKDPSNIGGRRPQQSRLRPTHRRPEVVAIQHPKSWMWLRFVLSVVYRMHMSMHEQYRDISIGDEHAARIRQFLLKDDFDEMIFNYDITTVMVAREGPDYLHAFSVPAFADPDTQGGFKVVFGIWGLWIMVGCPTGTIPGNFLIPKHESSIVYCPVISVEQSLRWYAALFAGDI